MQERLAKYLHDNDPLADERGTWESLTTEQRNAYRVAAYNALMFLRDQALPSPVFPDLYGIKTEAA